MTSSRHDPVGEWWRGQVAELDRWDRLVRGGQDDSVHQMRVSARRLRSVLATYRPLLDSARTEPVRAELTWLAALLGDVRDPEVLQVRLRRRAGELDLEPAGTEPLLTALAVRQAEAAERLRAGLDGARYRELTAVLATTQALPWADGPPSDKALRKQVRRTWRRLAAAVEAAEHSDGAEQRRTRLHEVRKKAKRTRYATEVLTATHGKDARRLAKAAKAVQSVLGELNDAAVMLRELEAYALVPGTSAEILAPLRAAEETAADDAEGRFASAWERANRPKVRRWLGGR